MNDELISRYNTIKRKQQDFENKKIQINTSIGIKEKELETIKGKLTELGVTDFDNLDAFIQEKRDKFNSELQELEGKLDGTL